MCTLLLIVYHKSKKNTLDSETPLNFLLPVISSRTLNVYRFRKLSNDREPSRMEQLSGLTLFLVDSIINLQLIVSH